MPNIKVPQNVVNFFRSIADPSYDDPILGNLDNPYEFAKKRLNKISLGRSAYKDLENDPSPLAKFQTLRGAMTAYWSDKKLEAWKPTLAVGALATLGGVNMYWMTEAYASAISTLFDGGLSSEFLTKSISVGGHGLIMYLCNTQGFSVANSLERNVANHIRDCFTEAIAQDLEIFDHMTEFNAQQENNKEKDKSQEKTQPHIALERAPEDLAQNIVGLGRNSVETVFGIAAMTYGLAHNSMPIEVLGDLGRQLGDWGTFGAAMATVGAYSSYTIYKGTRLGKEAEKALEGKKRADAELTRTLVMGFEENKHTPKNVLEKIIDKKDIVARKWADYDAVREKYIRFREASIMGNWLISPAPILTGIPLDNVSLSSVTQQTFLASHAQIQILMGQVSNAVDIVSARGTITVPAKMISEMAQEFEKVRMAQKTDITLKPNDKASNEIAEDLPAQFEIT